MNEGINIKEHNKINSERQLYEYVCDSRYFNEAKELSNFISSLKPEVRVYCYQYPTSKQYTCWYVGFSEQQNPYVLHFDIKHPKQKDRKHRKFEIWFRRPYSSKLSGSKPLLSEKGFELTKQDQDFRKISVIELNKPVKQIINDYLLKIRSALLKGEVELGRIHKKCQVG